MVGQRIRIPDGSDCGLVPSSGPKRIRVWRKSSRALGKLRGAGKRARDAWAFTPDGDHVAGPSLIALLYREVRDDEETTRLVNDSPYGSTPAIYTREQERAERFAAGTLRGRGGHGHGLLEPLRLPGSGPALDGRAGQRAEDGSIEVRIPFEDVQEGNPLPGILRPGGGRRALPPGPGGGAFRPLGDARSGALPWTWNGSARGTMGTLIARPRSYPRGPTH